MLNRISVSFISVPSKQHYCLSLVVYLHSYTYRNTYAKLCPIILRPQRKCLTFLCIKKEKNHACTFPPQSASHEEKGSLQTLTPVWLTRNEALCHCHIASPSCRNRRNALKVVITDERQRERCREWEEKEGRKRH